MDELDDRLRSGGGVLRRRDNADIAGTLDRQLRTGALVAVHPGVYSRPGALTEPSRLLLAAALWAGPDAVLTGWAAARLTFWPRAPLPEITVALPRATKGSRGTVRIVHRNIPPELIVHCGPIGVTRPCLTAVDLAETRRGVAAIDEALRTRAATLQKMWSVLDALPYRNGNARRRQALHESRHEPWSEPEREAHRLLDSSGITGWVTNAPILCYLVDILFVAERVILEIDGWETHGTRIAFEADRRRRNELELAGYRVLNFTWRQLVDDPAWVIQCVHDAIGR